MAKDTIMVGAGGYAATYVNYLLDGNVEGLLRLKAVIDPYAEKSPVYPKFKDTVPIFNTLDDFYAENTAELAIISTPIFLHYEQCVTALQNGSHVLCEKPLVPTLDALNKLDAVVTSTQRKLAVGFQWCYSDVVCALKERILAGEFGKPTRLKSLVCWPRDEAYYTRSGGWAGKRTHEGKPVYDAVISNATAHYIQIILFLLGADMESAAEMDITSCICNRANDIETFDTIELTGTAAGAKVYYAASHALNYQINPVMDYHFEKARIMVNMVHQDFDVKIHHADGRIEIIKNAIGNGEMNRLAYMAAYIDNKREWICSTKTVRPFTQLMHEIFNNYESTPFPAADIICDENKLTYVKNLHLKLMDNFYTFN